MAKKKIKMDKTKRKQFITFFMIMIFSVLLAGTAGIKDIFIRLLFQLLLLSGQIVIVKTIIEDYYSD